MRVLKLQWCWSAEQSWSNAKSIGTGFWRACTYLCGHFWYYEELLKAEDNSVFSLEEESHTKTIQPLSCIGIGKIIMRRSRDHWARLALRSDCCVQLTGACKEDEAKLFLEAHGNRMRGKRRKLAHGNFQLSIKKKFYTVRRVKCWNRVLARLWNFHPWRYSSLTGQGPEKSSLIGPPLSRRLA